MSTATQTLSEGGPIPGLDGTSIVLEQISDEVFGPQGVAALVDVATLIEGHDEARAEAAYRDAIVLDPAHIGAHAGLASLLCRQGRDDEAVDVINAAVERHGGNAQLHHVRGTVLESSGRLAAALEAYRRALRLDGGLAEPHYRMSLLCERLGAPVTSARHLDTYEALVAGHRLNSRLS